jgi:hypothetical protein
MAAITPKLRLAIFTVWPQKCVWGHEPITLKEMEVDHLIPKSLHRDELAEALNAHGLPPDFDLEAEENLAPSCGACNGVKGKRIPPKAPGITLLLDEAAAKADVVRASAASTLAKGKVELTVGKLLTADLSDEATYEAIKLAAQELGAFVEASAPHVHSLKLTSSVGIGVSPTGTWLASRFVGFGDCPNENCITGDIDWVSYPDGCGAVEGGACNTCGTFAVRCPDCECESGAFFDDFPCLGCDNSFELVRDKDAGEVEAIVVTRTGA